MQVGAFFVTAFVVAIVPVHFRSGFLVQANDFPSLLVANASVAIILDHEYLDADYVSTLSAVQAIVERVLREQLRTAPSGTGLNIRYYSWTQINFDKDFTAVISISDCANTWRTFDAVRRANLVYIALTEADCERLPADEALMIPIIALGQELPQILLDVRAAQAVNWKSSVLLYDETFDRDGISKVVRSLSAESRRNNAAMTVSLFKIPVNDSDGNAVRSTLQSLAASDKERNYLVISNAADEIMQIAGELGMLDTMSQWLFLLTTNRTNVSSRRPINAMLLGSNVREGGNVAIAQNVTDSTEQCGVNLKLICHFEEVLVIFVQSIVKVFGMEMAIYGQISDEEWEAIRLTKRERRDNVNQFVRTKLVDSNMCSTCLRWNMLAVETWAMRFRHASLKTPMATINGAVATPADLALPGRPLVNQVATWEPTNGMLTTDVLFPHVAHGFRGLMLPVVAYHNPPWQMLQYNDVGEIVSKRGIVMHILDELSQKLNFTYYIVDPVHQRNTSATISDVYAQNLTIESTLNVPTEVIELLTSDEVFMGACGLTINEHSRRLVNFTRPFCIQTYAMLIARPKELGRLYLFMAPFTSDTWACLIATIVLIGPLLFAVNYCTPYNDHMNTVRTGGLFRLSNCCWYIYGALLQQGGMYLPRSDSARIIVGTWWLVVLVVVTTYCGNLVAFLTFPKIDTPLSSVAQLVNSAEWAAASSSRSGSSGGAAESTVTWGMRSGTFLELYLKHSDSPKYKRLYEGATFYDRETSDIIQRVRGNRHVYIDWKSNLQFIMKREFLETDSCDFSLGAEDFLDEQIGLVLSPHSPYLGLVNNEIYRLQQMGFVQKWLAEYLPTRDRCWSGTNKLVQIENHTVNLNDMQGCFLVLLVGVGAAMLIILGECVLKRYTGRAGRKGGVVKEFKE